MYHLLLPAIKAILEGTNAFGAVVCGTGTGSYPLANVILRQAKPVSGKTSEDARVLVQVQSAEGNDTESSYLQTLELMATAKDALNDKFLPGHGARKMHVEGIETAQVKDTGEMIYYLPVKILVDPASFMTT